MPPLTQTHLAERLGVRQTTVSGWETGVRTPSVRHLRLLARSLSVPVDVLLALADGEEAA